MIIQVMGFLFLVTLLTTGAAWSVEQGLRRLGAPTRWLWLAAMIAPVLLLIAPLVPRPGPVAAPDAPMPAFELMPLVVGPAPDVFPIPIEMVAAVSWALLSLAFAAFLAATYRTLLRERSHWDDSHVSGRRVYVSPDRGPAVAGVMRPWIVLPRWSLGLPAAELDLVLLHEEEHVLGRDSALLAAGLALVVATPWNPVSWLQLRLLRTAMEVDCDRRVLRRAPDRARYGNSLLSVAARSSGLSLGLAAFTERSQSLETRILAMTPRHSRWTPLRAAAFVLLGSLIAAQACSVDIAVLDGDEDSDAAAATTAESSAIAADGPRVTVPSSDEAPGARPSDEPDQRAVRADPTDERRAIERATDLSLSPQFTPFTVAPTITNREEVVRAMTAEYPPLLKDAGIGGTVSVYFFINELGVVDQVLLNQSSGHEALDQAALAVADVYRFAPALNRDHAVPVWVSFPITFQVR